MSLQGMMSSLVWFRFCIISLVSVGGAVPQLLLIKKKTAIQDSSETRGNRTIALWKGKECGFWIALNYLLSFSVFCQVQAAEKRQRWSGPRSGHCQAVMVQIYLYKNQWVAKLKRGCMGQETIWKMTCPSNAQWRILSTSQRNDAFNH